MAIMGDRYTAEYEGHSIELVRDNLIKHLKLYIDGQEVATASCALPHDITLSGSFEHNGALHSVVAKSYVTFPATVDTIEVDGSEIQLSKIE